MTERLVGHSKTVQELSSVKETKISDEEIGNFLSAFGNHEAKGITLLIMNRDVVIETDEDTILQEKKRAKKVFTPPDLFEAVMRAQGEEPGWEKLREGAPFQYCSQSFAPFGLVEEHIDPSEGIWGYALTDKGIDALVADSLLLDLSLQHERISQIKLFSSSNSRRRSLPDEENAKTRAPLTRLTILREIVKGRLPLRVADIVTATGKDDSTIGKHLRALNKAGIITYESRGTNVPFSFYTLSVDRPNDPPPTPKRQISLTHQIYQVLLEHPEEKLTAEQVARYIIQKSPQRGEQKAFLSQVYNILSHLEKEGYATRDKFSHTEKKGSDITLTPDQKAFIEELLSLIEGFQNRDPQIWERGRNLAREIIRDPQKVSTLMKKAKENSPHAQRVPKKRTKALITSFIREADAPLSNKDLNSLLENNGIKLGENRLRRLTKEVAAEEEDITSFDKGSEKYFTFIGEQEEVL